MRLRTVIQCDWMCRLRLPVALRLLTAGPWSVTPQKSHSVAAMRSSIGSYEPMGP